MKKILIAAALVLSHLCFGATVSKSTHITVSQVIPAYDNVSSNWANVGLLKLGGIDAVDAGRTACSQVVSPSGKTPPTSGDDAALANAAVTACAANTILTLGTSACTCVAPCTFQIDQSENITVNKSITVRGYGSACTSATSNGTFWPVAVNVYNGAIQDWLISNSTLGAFCGVTSSSTSGCTMQTGVFFLSPSGNFNWGWAGCFLSTTPTGCGTTLTADAAQGDTTVHVTSTANFSTGMVVLIDEDPQLTSQTNPAGGGTINASPEMFNTTGSPAVMRFEGGDGDSPYSFATNRVNAELHLITSIGSGTLTFDDPLTLAFRQSGSHDARVYWPTVQGSTANPFLQKALVEDIGITKAADGGVQFVFCLYCGMKNVEVSNWIQGGASPFYSLRTQIDTVYIHGCTDCNNNGDEYAISIEASTECYVVNSIFVLGGKGMVGRASNSCVVAYNYQDQTFYMAATGSTLGDRWVDMGVNASHYAGTHHWLFEANSGDNCDGDETHGNALYHTFFRNQCTGIRTTFTDPSNSQTVNDSTGSCWVNLSTSSVCVPLRAAGPMAMNYWYSYVGNVLGLAGITTTGNGWVYQGAYCGGGGCIEGFASNKAIWMSGWAGSEFNNTDTNLTTNTNPFIFRNCNYDYVTASVADCAGGSFSSTLPNSFYTASAPPFFNTGSMCSPYPFPWVNASGGTKLLTNTCGGAGLPAKARFIAGTYFTNP